MDVRIIDRMAGEAYSTVTLKVDSDAVFLPYKVTNSSVAYTDYIAGALNLYFIRADEPLTSPLRGGEVTKHGQFHCPTLDCGG